MIVSMEYVEKKLGKVILLDAKDYEVYTRSY